MNSREEGPETLSQVYFSAGVSHARVLVETYNLQSGLNYNDRVEEESLDDFG